MNGDPKSTQAPRGPAPAAPEDSHTAVPELGMGTAPVQGDVSFEETMASSVEGDLSSAGSQTEFLKLAPGDVINESYQVVRLIGEGGMGAVYEARDLRLGRLVAIKCVLLSHRDPQKNAGLLRLFRRDATATAQLSHPNVISIYDFGEYRNQPYLVLELLLGKPLDAIIKDDAPLHVNETVNIMLQICGALAHAHKAGIVHRDLKPGNVFLLDDGLVKVLDFGMADLDTSRSLLKAALQKDTVQIQDAFGEAPQGGSPGYMAPEQWRDNEQDARSDVWSMGILLFELLTGELPFDWRELRQSAWGLHPPLPVDPILDRIPVLFAEMLRKALSWEMADRTESAEEFAAELKAAFVGWQAEQSGVALNASMLGAGSNIDDRYRLTRKLGEGGFGVVFEAEQLTTGQSVAIKVLHPQSGATPHQTENMRERFEREMQVIASIKHPNIVRLFDSGKLPDGQLYIVLEFIEGKPLSDVLEEEGQLTEDEARHLMLQVLDALSSAHEKGLVHRDLKPDNIMVTRSGARRNAMVLDFGIAGVVDGGDSKRFKKITATNEIIGTPSYMAPEQLKGEKTTPQTDIYAWGLVFLECLTGETAIDDVSGAAIIYKQLIPEPVPIPEDVRQGIFGSIISRATQKTLDARFLNGLEALEALQATAGLRSSVSNVVGIPPTSITTADPAASLAASPPPEELPPLRDNLKVALGVIGGLVVLAVVLFLVLFLGQDDGGDATTGGGEARETSPQETQVPPAADVSGSGAVGIVRADTSATAAQRDTPPEPVPPTAPVMPERVTVKSVAVFLGLEAQEIDTYLNDFGTAASFDIEAGIGVLPEGGLVPPNLEVMTHEARWVDWTPNLSFAPKLDALCPGALPSPGADALPITGVGALEAEAFCEGIGMRLPTVQEWEAVARGSMGRAYSFEGEVNAERRASLEAAPTAELSAFNKTPEGVYAMTGSVWEWASCPKDIELNACQDGFALKGGSYKQGGHWWLAALVGRVPGSEPGCARRDDIGFRCVKEVP